MKPLAAVVGAVACWHCTADAGAQLELRRLVQVNPASCAVSASAVDYLDVRYDPAPAASVVEPGIASELGGGLYIVLSLVNHMEDRRAAEIRGADGENIRPQTNDAILVGYDTCWFAPDAEFNQLGSHSDGFAKPCTPAGGNTRFVAAHGTVTTSLTGGAEFLSSVEILNITDLQAVWPGFDPREMTRIGEVTDKADAAALGSADDRYYDPRFDRNGPGWGAFPISSWSVDLVVQMRAVAQLQTGRTIKSNWFNFRVAVCPGCTLACGLRPFEYCAGDQCPGLNEGDDPVACPADGACLDGSRCRPGDFVVAGQVATGVTCKPHSGYGTVVCEDVNPCD